MPGRPPFEGRVALAVAALTLLGAALRLHGLTTQSLWLDECLSVEGAARPARLILSYGDGEPPLYLLIVHGLLASGARSEWWLRLPAALAGTLAIPLAYAVGRRLEGRTVALVAAALLTVNPLAVWFSQETRTYALVMLCALAGTLAFLRVLHEGRFRDVAAYALAVWVGIGLHYYYVFVVAAHACLAVHDAVRYPAHRRRWLWAGLVTVAAVALWIPALIPDVAAQAAEDSGRRFSFGTLPYTALTFVGGFSLGPALRELHSSVLGGSPTWPTIRAHLLAAGLAIGVVAMLGVQGLGGRRDRHAALTVLLVVLPIAGALAASAVAVGYRPRYVLSALPFALLWMARVSEPSLVRPGAALLVVLAMLELVGLAQRNLPEYVREDTRSAARWIAERRPDATVVLVGATSEGFRCYASPGQILHAVFGNTVRDAATVAARLDAELSGPRDVFLVASRPWTVDPAGRARAILDAHLVLREEADFPGVTVRWYAHHGEERS